MQHCVLSRVSWIICNWISSFKKSIHHIYIYIYYIYLNTCQHCHNYAKTALEIMSEQPIPFSHSCETQLLITLTDFYKSINSHIQVDVGILDFSRAFDTVPHERLMGKLASCGIHGPINDWIRAFLTGRTMSVVVDGEGSDTARVLSGVPQGTVLGPLLFLIYINDMPSQVSTGTYIRLFADDCLVYREIHTIQQQEILQHELLQLQKWADCWGMRFNPNKWPYDMVFYNEMVVLSILSATSGMPI